LKFFQSVLKIAQGCDCVLLSSIDTWSWAILASQCKYQISPVATSSRSVVLDGRHTCMQCHSSCHVQQEKGLRHDQSYVPTPKYIKDCSILFSMFEHVRLMLSCTDSTMNLFPSPSVDMSEHCKKTETVASALQVSISSHRYKVLTPCLNCPLTLTTGPGNQLVATLVGIGTETSGSCEHNRLDVYDGPKADKSKLLSGM